MNSPRRKLAIEKRESDKLSLKVFRRPFSSESTDQSSAIRDYSEFAVFADQWRRAEDLLATHFDERSNRHIRFNDERRVPTFAQSASTGKNTPQRNSWAPREPDSDKGRKKLP